MKHPASWPLKHIFVMNIRLLFMLFCAALVFQNCKKSEESIFFTTEEDLIPLYFLSDSFLCTATKEVPGLGSINWTANILGVIRNGKLSVTFITYQDSVNVDARERLSFGNIPVALGSNNLGNDTYLPFSSYSRWLSDGDVLNASWDIDNKMDNTLEVTQLDTICKVVTGKFDVHFKMITQGSFGFVHSERINFKNGSFIAKY